MRAIFLNKLYKHLPEKSVR